MGKKPVFGMIGLVWAGMALTGCGTCSNCRNSPNRYNATPAFQTRNTKTDAAATPTMIGDAKPAPTPDAGAARLTDTKDAVGAPKSSMIEPTSGTTTAPSTIAPASAPSFSRPTTQSSLRPSDSMAPAAAPSSFDNGAPARLTSTGDSKSMSMPPRPVTTSNTPSTSTPPAPSGSSLPPLSSAGSASPPPPAPPAGFENGAPPPVPSYLPPGK